MPVEVADAVLNVVRYDFSLYFRNGVQNTLTFSLYPAFETGIQKTLTSFVSAFETGIQDTLTLSLYPSTLHAQVNLLFTPIDLRGNEGVKESKFTFSATFIYKLNIERE